MDSRKTGSCEVDVAEQEKAEKEETLCSRPNPRSGSEH